MSKTFSLYLDFVRFFASFLVVIFHANAIYRIDLSITTYGHEAVVVFFVLSGFVIAYVAENKEDTLKDFLLARAARIFSVAIPAIFITALLDYIGFGLNEAVYPEGSRAWDYPLVRIISSSLYLNEIWTLGIQLFSNVPYWSLNYEVWYYIVFAALFYVSGGKRWFLFAVLCIALGPKILLLMPIWWMGVFVYRHQAFVNMSRPAAWVVTLLSVLGLYVYAHFKLGHVGWDLLKGLLGEEWHLQLSFSRQFVTDYFLGLVLMLHFAGLRILLSRDINCPKPVEASIRYLAGATFSLYLFHQPLLWFYSAIFSVGETNKTTYLIALPLTVITAIILSIFTERKNMFGRG